MRLKGTVVHVFSTLSMTRHKATPGDIVVQTFGDAIHTALGLLPEAGEVACFLEEGWLRATVNGMKWTAHHQFSTTGCSDSVAIEN